MEFLFSCSVAFDSFVTPFTIAHQSPLPLGFPRQEYWSGLPFPSLGDLPKPGIEPESPAFQVDSLPLSHQGSLMNGVGAFMKEISESSLSLSAI